MDPSIGAEEFRASDVGEARRGAHAAARARWGGLELSFQQFACHLQRLGWERELPKYAEELYLCCACGLACLKACRRLESEYFPALEVSLERQCRRRDFVEDVLQQVRERLLAGPAPKIASYEGRGPLASWLQRVARRLASDLYRQETKARRIAASGWWQVLYSADAAFPSEASGPLSIDARYLGKLERALVGALAQLSMEDRHLLNLHYVQGLSADEIGRCLGRDRSTVYRRLNQITARVRRWSMDSAREQTGIRDRQELDSLFQTHGMWIYLDPMVWLDPARAGDASTNAPRLKRG